MKTSRLCTFRNLMISIHIFSYPGFGFLPKRYTPFKSLLLKNESIKLRPTFAP